MISWGLRGTHYQNTLNYGRDRTLKTALQPQLIIHIVSHSYLLFDYQQFKIIKMNTKQQEQLKFIEIANDLNQEFYEKNGEVEDRFYYSTDGYIDTFGFGDKMLWSSEMDDRKFIEDLNDYEDFKPFIINVFNDWIATMNGYVL